MFARTKRKPIKRNRPRSPEQLSRSRRFGLKADVMEEEWGEGEETNMKLSKAFVVVFVLHLIAVGGILAFHFLEKRPGPAAGEAEGNDPAARREAAGRPAVPALPGSKIYIAQKGDTVASIARDHRVEETAILASNPKLMPGAGGVPENHPVQLPDLPAEEPEAGSGREGGAEIATGGASLGASGRPEEASGSQGSPKALTVEGGASKAGSGEVASSGQTHTVLKGENPYGIARKYGVTQEELMKLNGIADPTKVQIGTVLQIPAKP